MKKGFRTVSVAVVVLVALAVATAATATSTRSSAYTSPKLTVAYNGTTTNIVASAAVGDDATAVASIVIPNGTTITVPATPGAKVGTVKAQVSALALGGALLPLAGDVIVPPPGAIPAASQAACTRGQTPSAILLLNMSAAGQTIPLPAYVLPASPALASIGSSVLQFCLPPPDIPQAAGGATFGAKFLSADLTLNGVFSAVTQGAWVGFWTPWQNGNGQLNAAGTVASPSVVAPGAITLAGKKVAGRAVLAGKVSQGGTGLATKVAIWGAVGKAAFKPVGVTTAKATGAFAWSSKRLAKATSFKAQAVVPSRAVPALCGQFSSLPVPCVNATVSGFTATSRVVAIKK